MSHETQLGTYTISLLELAFDFHMEAEDEAQEVCLEVVACLRKRWHQRLRVWFEYDELRPPPPGVIPGPTFYFEDGRARTGLKGYCRYAKSQDGFDTNRPIFRLEWTLRGSQAIQQKMGIEKIEGLQNVNSVAFLEHHLRLETLNLERLGKWLSPRSKHPRRAALTFLRARAYGEPKPQEDWPLTLLLWKSSAQVRGYLRSERARIKGKRGRRTVREKKFAMLSDYKIETFFDRVTPSFIADI
jgi:hypothetical protein